ncbi:MAG: retroviral-like aspartic protease family protein [Elusimicrobiota bacterium]
MQQDSTPQQSKFHHAFRIIYNDGIVKELVTDVSVKFPAKEDIRKYKAVWDTGATHTAITPKVVSDLQLQPIDVAKVYVVDSEEPKTVDVYLVDIILPNRVRIPNIHATCSPIQDCDVLIGMNIIQLGDFNISKKFDGHKYMTMFSFCIPSHSNPVDLLEKSEMVNLRNQKKRNRT